jgi:hypothetical protein
MTVSTGAAAGATPASSKRRAAGLRVFGAPVTGLPLALLGAVTVLCGVKGLLPGAVVWAVYAFSQRSQGARRACARAFRRAAWAAAAGSEQRALRPHARPPVRAAAEQTGPEPLAPARSLRPPGLSIGKRSLRLTTLRLGPAGAAVGSAGGAPGGRASGVLRLSLEALQRYLTTGPAARACRRAAALLGGAGRSDGAGGLPVSGCTSCTAVRRVCCAACPPAPAVCPDLLADRILTRQRCGRRAACQSCRRCSTA